jgi:hypothetical protein
MDFRVAAQALLGFAGARFLAGIHNSDSKCLHLPVLDFRLAFKMIKNAIGNENKGTAIRGGDRKSHTARLSNEWAAPRSGTPFYVSISSLVDIRRNPIGARFHVPPKACPPRHGPGHNPARRPGRTRRRIRVHRRLLVARPPASGVETAR